MSKTATRPDPVGLPLVGAADFDALLLAATPLLDLRAPEEFARGAIPGALNLPLLDDDERAQVGTCYKRDGQAAAVELGHRLVSGAVREARLQGWLNWARAHPQGVIYCFRGGQRSTIVQSWLAEAGVVRPRISGGYKALRQHLLAHIDQHAQRLQPLMLGGRTGTGKTRLLAAVPRSLDLEGRAGHRGSAFGTRVGGQPAPIDFENRLALDLLSLHSDSDAPVVIEDEGRNVGRLSVPEPLFERMRAAPLAIVECALADRVRVTLEEYVLGNLAEFQAAHGAAEGFVHFSAYLGGALDKIRRRLGDERHRQLDGALREALQAHAEHGDVAAHRAWIEPLLSGYYDPMYDYQLRNKADRIAFRGDPDAVVAWLRAQG